MTESDDDDSNETNGMLVNIISKSKRAYKSLNASGLRLEAKFGQPTINSISEWIKLCINELLFIIKRELEIEPQDRVGIIFTNTNNIRVDFSISFRPFSQYTSDTILFEIEKVIQSNTRFFTDDNLIINIDHVRIPVGYGHRFHIGKSSDRYYKLHEISIFSPNLQPEDHGLCLAVAIVVGIPHSTQDINRYNYLTYGGNYNELIQEVRTLCGKANVNLQHGGSIDEIIQFQQHLGPEYRIIMYESRDGKVIIFKACHSYKYSLNILLDECHYSLVLTPIAAFATAYFCGYCCNGYTTKLGHKRCRVRCNKCFQSSPCDNTTFIKCDLCKREFASATCLQNHILHGICEKYKICQNCCMTYAVKKNSEHICGSKYCKIYKEDMPIRHECFIAVT